MWASGFGSLEYKVFRARCHAALLADQGHGMQIDVSKG